MAVVAVLALGLGTAAPSGATATTDRERVIGLIDGRAPFEFGSGGCSFAHQHFQALVYTRVRWKALVDVDACVDFGTTTPSFVVTGTFVIHTARGWAIGTATGTLGSIPNAPFAIDLLVTHRRHVPVRRGATLHLRGTWSTAGTADPAGRITGTLSI
jgi:hypothetical protein